MHHGPAVWVPGERFFFLMPYPRAILCGLPVLDKGSGGFVAPEECPGGCSGREQAEGEEW